MVTVEILLGEEIEARALPEVRARPGMAGSVGAWHYLPTRRGWARLGSGFPLPMRLRGCRLSEPAVTQPAPVDRVEDMAGAAEPCALNLAQGEVSRAFYREQRPRDLLQ